MTYICDFISCTTYTRDVRDVPSLHITFKLVIRIVPCVSQGSITSSNNFSGELSSIQSASFLQIHRCFIQQELLNSYIQNPIIIMPRFDILSHNNDLLERILYFNQ